LRGADLVIAFSRADLDAAQHAKFSSIIQGCARLP
jgi:hypothetical protein